MFFKLVKLLKIISEPLFIKALFKGAAAGVEHKSVLCTLGEIRHVIDVGANRGQFALIARKCFPDARIDSFEPLPGPASIYRRVFYDDSQVLLHQAAIGYRPEVRTMHISQRDDSSSLLPISTAQTTMFPGTGEIATTEVRVAPLDEFVTADDLHAPAMLKLDVQGFEHEALIGCESLLPQFALVYCECSFIELYSGQKLAWEIIDWLSAKGFGLVGVFNPAYDKCGQAVQADFLFSRKNGRGLVEK